MVGELDGDRAIGGRGAIFAETGSGGCVVLGNALPKAGTYLLHRLVTRLGPWVETGVHVNVNGYRSELRGPSPLVASRPVETLRRLLPGQCVAGHLAYDAEVDAALGDAGFEPAVKHVFLVRDPRDLIVSWLKFAMHSEAYVAHAEHRAVRARLMAECKDEASRLHFAIAERSRFPYRKYVGWLSSVPTLTLRFEDLHASVVAAGRGGMGGGLEALLVFLGVDTGRVDPVALHESVYGQGKTAMRGGQGGVGGGGPSSFRASFLAEHYAAVDTPYWREAVSGLGYAWD